ncbi:TolC family protein [Vallitalea okinawensis]|uniref:TolC family protein n=1 Tax=Vallitalea okinawensis TaxID=2078660 RepID=UPI000CFCFD8A|nr:TolC family protein [Vallitalea okinawensis]
MSKQKNSGILFIIKYLLITFSIIISFSLTSLAEEVKTISEEEAIAIYLVNSYDVQKIKIENQLLSMSYEDSKENLGDQLNEVEASLKDYEEAKEDDSDDEQDLRDIYYKEALNYANQEKQFQLLDFDLITLDEQETYAISQEINTLREELYDYYLLEQDLALQEKQLSISKQELDLITVQYELGIVSELTVMENQYAYEDLILKRDLTQHQIDLANEALKIKLSLPVENTYEFEIALPTTQFVEELSLENMLTYYKTNNITYVRQLEVVNATNDYMTYLQGVYPDNSIDEDYVETYYNYQIDQINNEANLTNSINQVINTYYNYQSKNKSLLNTEADVASALKEYENEIIAYESGQISLYQLDQAEYSYLQTIKTYEQSVIDLNNSLMELLLLIYEE